MKCMFITLCSLAMIIASCGQTAAPPADEHYLLIGTYTSGKSEGIYVYKFNSKDGSFQPVSIGKGIKNPSYLAIAPDNKHVYSVSEGDNEGAITAFSFDKGTLNLLNAQPSGGNGPCYVAVDRTGKWVATGNYGSGSLAILPVKPDGSLGAPTTKIAHEGKSVNVNRQEKPHVHATVFSPGNDYLFVPDLGMDKVMVYRFDEKTGQLSASEPASVIPGAGPRHFDFHPSGKYAYLMEELSGTVTAFTYDKGKLAAIQNISSHPAGFKGAMGSADIHVSPDGRFLYASNRGESNTIAIFSIDEKTGKLNPEDYPSTLGVHPRNFNFDPTGNFILVANRDTDNIVIFRRDTKTGKLTPLKDQIHIPSPVCIKWAKI
jgi:6-phosphogluconolactonase